MRLAARELLRAIGQPVVAEDDPRFLQRHAELLEQLLDRLARLDRHVDRRLTADFAAKSGIQIHVHCRHLVLVRTPPVFRLHQRSKAVRGQHVFPMGDPEWILPQTRDRRNPREEWPHSSQRRTWRPSQRSTRRARMARVDPDWGVRISTAASSPLPCNWRRTAAGSISTPRFFTSSFPTRRCTQDSAQLADVERQHVSDFERSESQVNNRTIAGQVGDLRIDRFEAELRGQRTSELCRQDTRMRFVDEAAARRVRRCTAHRRIQRAVRWRVHGGRRRRPSGIAGDMPVLRTR